VRRDLVLNDLPADSITADQGQAARRKAIEKFRSGKTWLLITTDLLARVSHMVHTVHNPRGRV
jgi:superfamily II DNA/RNA helicase